MLDYDYVTLYLPYDGKTQKGPGTYLISQECVEWLEENVGPGTLSGQAWILAHQDSTYEWCYAGVEHSPESHYTRRSRCFFVKDINKAMLFKLTWGGQ
jgi:hypothetical protein